MADHTIIARTGAALAAYLRSVLVPDLLRDENEVGLVDPYEKTDYTVKIYLYDIAENTDIPQNGAMLEGLTSSRFPPIYLNLFYMITVASKSDPRYRAEEEARILGRIIQALHDEELSRAESLPSDDALPLRIQMLRLRHEEKVKVWATNATPYKLSLFYRVVPVAIDSELTRSVARVGDARLTVTEGVGERG